jgi:hypothetical protein
VGSGFVALEAPALQATIRSAFVTGEGSGPMAVELTFTPGADGRVVVVWRNRIVGFVPDPHAAVLRRQLDASDRAHVVADGRVYDDGTWWRVWVGPDPDGELPVPDAGYDELAPPIPSIFGFSLGESFRRPPGGRSRA